MYKVIVCFISFFILLFVTTPVKAAEIPLGPGVQCRNPDGTSIIDTISGNPRHCVTGYVCLPSQKAGEEGLWTCQEGSSTQGVFGVINPPSAISNLPFGSLGISLVLTNFVTLIYIIAGLIFIFMIVIGAVQWITSGGQKEGLENAQKRIAHAIIGIVILSIAFVLIHTIGQITGFQFFQTK